MVFISFQEIFFFVSFPITFIPFCRVFFMHHVSVRLSSQRAFKRIVFDVLTAVKMRYFYSCGLHCRVDS